MDHRPVPHQDRPPRSAIVNDPNRAGAPHYIARLIAKVITVSPKTPDPPTPPRPGRQTASFSQAKPTTSAGAKNCVHQRNQINHSSDNRPLQFIVQTTVTGPKSRFRQPQPASPPPHKNTPHNRPVRPPKAKDKNLCYATAYMQYQPTEPTRRASKNTPRNRPVRPPKAKDQNLCYATAYMQYQP